MTGELIIGIGGLVLIAIIVFAFARQEIKNKKFNPVEPREFGKIFKYFIKKFAGISKKEKILIIIFYPILIVAVGYAIRYFTLFKGNIFFVPIFLLLGSYLLLIAAMLSNEKWQRRIYENGFVFYNAANALLFMSIIHHTNLLYGLAILALIILLVEGVRRKWRLGR